MRKSNPSHPSPKLRLHRETIRQVERPELDRVHGEVTDPTICGLHTCIGTCHLPK